MTTRMEWTDELEESLLHLRMRRYGLSFKGTKSKAQITAAWFSVQESFNEANHLTCTVEQLKNKFQSMKTQYNNIKASEPETGNATESPIAYPSNWPALIEYFGDLSGMGNHDFGQTGGSLASSASPSSDSGVSSAGAEHKRNARKRKVDLGEAVAMMAMSLSKRISSADRPAAHAEDDHADGISAKLERMESSMAATMETQQHTPYGTVVHR